MSIIVMLYPYIAIIFGALLLLSLLFDGVLDVINLDFGVFDSSVFSLSGLFAGLSIFGLSGLIFHYFKYDNWISVALSALFGIIIFILGSLFLHFLSKSGQDDGVYLADNMLGMKGKVISGAPVGELASCRIVFNGAPVIVAAKSANELLTGEEVEVVKVVSSNSVIVSKIAGIEPSGSGFSSHNNDGWDNYK